MREVIAITGATGFVGSTLVDVLGKESRYELHAFGRRDWRNKYVATYTKWDITAGPLGREESPPVDILIHCAGSVSDWGTDAEMYTANVAGTQNVLQSFAKARQCIFISTASVYDPRSSKCNLREDASLPQRYFNSYAASKAAAEREALQSKIPFVSVLRPHAVYGKGDTKILPRLLSARRAGRQIIIGNGRHDVSLTAVENLAEAVRCAIEHPQEREIFNIADGKRYQLLSVIDLILREAHYPKKYIHVPVSLAYILAVMSEGIYKGFQIHKPPLLTRYVFSQLTEEYTLDISKAQRMLNYQPTYVLEDMVSGILAGIDCASSSS